jgi:gamma-glutamyltranspeptidase/glutathione hydrolase
MLNRRAFTASAAGVTLTARSAEGRGLAVSDSRIASEAAAEVLRSGGNAVDAAVALGFALAVTWPAAGNIGGGGFMLVRMADGRATAFDFRETAPGAATRGMYLDAKGHPAAERSTRGHLAAGVPGTVAGLHAAHRRYGRLAWSALLTPAVRLASEGFPVTHGLAGDLRGDHGLLSSNPESRRIFLADGRGLRAGERFVQQDLGDVLKRTAKEGPDDFYRGITAKLIVQEMQRGGGIITQRDLAEYRVRERRPLKGSFAGFELLTMPPPSSGGVALLQMLGMLARLDVHRLGVLSADARHLQIEVMKRAFADRAKYMGDPDYNHLEIDRMLSPVYLTRMADSIRMDRATPSSEIAHGEPLWHEKPQTTHYSVVDADGNAAACTYTLNGGYGSGVTVRGGGFLLNNEMDDFVASPGRPNAYGLIQSERNSIAPRRRPLSSMTPTLLLRGGRLQFVIGSPGGPTIINTVLQNVLGVTVGGMTLQQACDTPRIHHQWLPDEVKYEPRLPAEIRSELQRRGHRFSARPGTMGSMQGIQVQGDGWSAAVDRRLPDSGAASG